MKTNKDRAMRARAALLAHQIDDCHGSKVQAHAELAAAPASILKYLLADLRHWCDVNGFSYQEADRLAHETYTAEVVEARRAASAPTERRVR